MDVCQPLNDGNRRPKAAVEEPTMTAQPQNPEAPAKQLELPVVIGEEQQMKRDKVPAISGLGDGSSATTAETCPDDRKQAQDGLMTSRVRGVPSAILRVGEYTQLTRICIGLSQTNNKVGCKLGATELQSNIFLNDWHKILQNEIALLVFSLGLQINRVN
jgi:hypothetical protein